jgi:uncharacterized protein (DUF2267 family)
MKATEFYTRVARQLNVDNDLARNLTLSTLESLRHRLTQEVAEELAAQLPRDMEHSLNDPEYDELYTQQSFVGPLMNLQDTESNWDQSLGGLDLVSVHNLHDVAMQMQGVFSVIKQCVQDSTAQHLEDSLPQGIDQWFRDASSTSANASKRDVSAFE